MSSQYDAELASIRAAQQAAGPPPEYGGVSVEPFGDYRDLEVAAVVASGNGDRPHLEGEAIEAPMSDAAARIAQSFIDFDGFFGEEPAENDYLIEPWFPRGRQVRVYAKAKQGKSLIVLEGSAALASGRKFMRNPAGDPVHVLYLDFEMTRDDVRERLTDMGYGEEDEATLAEYFHYASLPRAAPLDTQKGGYALAETAIAVGAELVVIDTASRTVEGDENSNDTWQDFYRFTGMLLKQAGITFVILDHEGKEASAGARGGSAKNDDVDVVWRLTYNDPRVVLDTKGIKRIGWIPDRIELERLDSPLRHVIKERVYSAAEKALAAVLDAIDVPVDAGRIKAKRAVTEAEEADLLDARQMEAVAARDTVWQQAIWYRRENR